MTLDIREIPLSAARSIRQQVLKPGRPESEVAYPGDDAASAQHLGAFEGDVLVGVATFLPESCPDHIGNGAWRLRGVATMPAAQGRGVGSRLLSYGIERIWRQGATFIWCYGRTSARTFYQRHGFCALGNEFALPLTGPHHLFVLKRVV